MGGGLERLKLANILKPETNIQKILFLSNFKQNLSGFCLTSTFKYLIFVQNVKLC